MNKTWVSLLRELPRVTEEVGTKVSIERTQQERENAWYWESAGEAREGRHLTQNTLGKGERGPWIELVEKDQEEGRAFKVEVQHTPSNRMLSPECRFPFKTAFQLYRVEKVLKWGRSCESFPIGQHHL